ncbi:MAG: arginase [Gammaproteobacteria bacterium]|jgi:arginase|nr:arginase [Gammaproteobacteria bacterium]
MSISAARAIRAGRVQLVGAAWGLGAKDQRTAHGPIALKQAGLESRLAEAGLRVDWPLQFARPTGSVAPRAEIIAGLCRGLAAEIERSMLARNRFAVVGGDHSCAIGTWSGAHNGFGGRLGLVWVDAHMDAHTYDSSPSGAVHGMPVAALLGEGEPEFTGIVRNGPVFRPEDICLVGIRSYEPGEARRLERLGVKIFFMEDVHRMGAEAVFGEAIAIATRHTHGFGVSIDLDAFDPLVAPGVGSPAAGGLAADDVLPFLSHASRNNGFLGIEIAEYNPYRDTDQITAELVFEMLVAALTENEG